MKTKSSSDGLFYATTDNGITLPVLDITHPLFLASIDTGYLEKQMRAGLIKTGKGRKPNPHILRFLGRFSVIMAGFYRRQENDSTRFSYLNSLSTVICKLGPFLIPRGIGWALDRRFSWGFIPMRMRARDISICIAETLIPQLNASPEKSLSLVNIAGGTATDSINALLLILSRDPSLLANRKTEISVLDVDAFGPHFAEKSVAVLKAPGGKFNGLDIILRYIPYNWHDTAPLSELLKRNKGWIIAVSSEGGLFEYGSDEEITANLHAIRDSCPGSPVSFSGSALHETEKLNPQVYEMIRSTGVNVRFLGFPGLKKLTFATGWNIHRIVEENPNYTVFSVGLSSAS